MKRTISYGVMEMNIKVGTGISKLHHSGCARSAEHPMSHRGGVAAPARFVRPKIGWHSANPPGGRSLYPALRLIPATPRIHDPGGHPPPPRLRTSTVEDYVGPHTCKCHRLIFWGTLEIFWPHGGIPGQQQNHRLAFGQFQRTKSETTGSPHDGNR